MLYRAPVGMKVLTPNKGRGDVENGKQTLKRQSRAGVYRGEISRVPIRKLGPRSVTLSPRLPLCLQLQAPTFDYTYKSSSPSTAYTTLNSSLSIIC